MNNAVLICGKPNTGKTTAFNLMTGKFYPVGNRQGVTVEEATSSYKYKGEKYNLFDIPGAYALDGGNMEEEIASKRIKNFNGIIVYFSEAIKLKDDLKNLRRLTLLNKKIILAVNMADEFYKRGGSFDMEKAKKFFPFPIIVGDFNRKKEVIKLKEEIYNYQYTGGVLTIDEGEFFKFYKRAENPLGVDVFIKSPLCLYLSFASFTFFIFYIAFGRYGLGNFLGKLIEKGVNDLLKNGVEKLLISFSVSKFLIRLITVGIIEGVGSVLKFLPQILLLKFFLDVMELTGYLSRVAFSLDGLFSKIGLNGRAVFSMLMGFGCTAVAVTSTKGLENVEMKRRVTSSLSFMSCSAKIPVYFLISSTFNNPFIIILFVYVLGFILAFLEAFIDTKLTRRRGTPLILEIPPYRLPKISDIIKSLLNCAKGFIIKIGTVIVLVSSTACIFSSVSFSFSYVGEEVGKSILSEIGKYAEFLFVPIGIKDWRISTAVIYGIFAKEGIVSTLYTLSNGIIEISSESAISLIVFIMAYTPCLTAIFTIKDELGGKFAFTSAFLQFIEAYIISIFIYYIQIYPLLILAVITAVIIYAKIHGNEKRKIIKNTV